MTTGGPPRSAPPALLAGAVLLLGLVASVVPGTGGAFTATVLNSSNTAGAASRFTCTTTQQSANNKRNAYFEWALTGTTADVPDQSAAGNPGTSQPSGQARPVQTATSADACPNDPGSYYAPDGSSGWVSTSMRLTATPDTYSIAIWFTTTQAGGYLIGLNSQGGQTNAGNFDHHLYVGTSGRVNFGTYNAGFQLLTSPAAYNDGKWHLAVGTQSPSTGMALWMDGVKVASNASWTVSQNNTGYWRIAQGPLDNWPDAPASTFFKGGMRFAAAYSIVLSDAEIAAEYANGKPGP